MSDPWQSMDLGDIRVEAYGTVTNPPPADQADDDVQEDDD